MKKSKQYFLLVGLFLIYPFQAACSEIKKETTTKFLIQENDTIIDLIITHFYTENGTILKTIWEEPFNKSQTIVFFKDNKLWYSITYHHDLKEDSTMHYYDDAGDLSFTETFSNNYRIRKSEYTYVHDTIRKDNYQLGNDSTYFLSSYEVTKVDSIAHTSLVEFVNLEDVYSSHIYRFSFDNNGNLIALQTLNNLDRGEVIHEQNFTYKDQQIIMEISVTDDRITSSISFHYTDLDLYDNWTKKNARTTLPNGTHIEVGYEVRIIEYW